MFRHITTITNVKEWTNYKTIFSTLFSILVNCLSLTIFSLPYCKDVTGNRIFVRGQQWLEETSKGLKSRVYDWSNSFQYKIYEQFSTPEFSVVSVVWIMTLCVNNSLKLVVSWNSVTFRSIKMERKSTNAPIGAVASLAMFRDKVASTGHLVLRKFPGFVIWPTIAHWLSP